MFLYSFALYIYLIDYKQYMCNGTDIVRKRL
ncbi:MAG: hypothetical protein EZS26_002064 [Candidatus Ordinivivax streblomastigis]|uniref:Uncharacterized protein n=1 Tax=Candidatus Ordinivivax streblomastigis TaxID=2540710 RepID=A0A5M8P003_9BACT|nr:MAG: hypothetical protein EZS26_002064 [Candidatus Ordinivivax streblomastigis]